MDGMRSGSSEVELTVDRASIVPIYRQIYERLRAQILAGALPEGMRLPPERALSGRLAVNRSTVVRAYRHLAADGLISQRVGSGSRVASIDGGRPDRSPAVPWWVTLPPWRAGQFPAVLGELAASEHGDSIAFVQGVPPAEPSPLADLAHAAAALHLHDALDPQSHRRHDERRSPRAAGDAREALRRPDRRGRSVR